MRLIARLLMRLSEGWFAVRFAAAYLYADDA